MALSSAGVPVAPARVTLAGVAARAGVSVSTASLAFSGGARITPETRERVLAAAEELGYAGPNPLGRQLRSGRSGIVGLVLGDNPGRAFSDPVAVELLDGLATTLLAAGLGALFVPGLTGDPLISRAPMDAAVLVWGVVEDDANLAALTARGVPVVVGEGPPVPGAALVGLDDQAGMRTAVEHLAALGHSRVAEVTLPLHKHAFDEPGGFATAERLAATNRAAAGHRVAGFREVLQPVATWEAPASTVDAGKAAAQAILDQVSPRPTAIVAQSDLLAAGVVLALRERGLVPGADISVVGFDGLALPWLAPDVLTSVRQPLREKGRLLAEAVVNLIERGEPAEIYLPVELTIGTTTAPPK